MKPVAAPARHRAFRRCRPADRSRWLPPSLPGGHFAWPLAWLTLLLAVPVLGLGGGAGFQSGPRPRRHRRSAIAKSSFPAKPFVNWSPVPCGTRPSCP